MELRASKYCKNISSDDVLGDFMAHPDNNFDYYKISEHSDHQISLYEYKMQSQKWPIFETDGLDSTIWQHKIDVYIPENVDAEPKFIPIFLSSGINRDKNGNDVFVPYKEVLDYEYIAKERGVPVINLHHVANSFIMADGEALDTNDFIAYTYHKILEDYEANKFLLAFLPMTKAIVRAMDAVTSILQDEFDIREQKNFVLIGASKLAISSWLAAMVDDRVSDIVPIFANFLNMSDALDHLCNSYKDGCPDYVTRNFQRYNIMNKMGTEAFDRILSIMDPICYLDAIDPKYSIYETRLRALKKYMINGANDDYFVVDSANFYFHHLINDGAYIRLLPNTIHYMSGNIISVALESGERIISDINDYLGLRIDGVEFPKLEWSFGDNKITVFTDIIPYSAILWVSENEQDRDFRCVNKYDGMLNAFYIAKKVFHALVTGDVCDNEYSPHPLEVNCKENETCTIEGATLTEHNGWYSSFIELIYNIADHNITLTSDAMVIPDVYPH